MSAGTPAAPPVDTILDASVLIPWLYCTQPGIRSTDRRQRRVSDFIDRVIKEDAFECAVTAINLAEVIKWAVSEGRYMGTAQSLQDVLAAAGVQVVDVVEADAELIADLILDSAAAKDKTDLSLGDATCLAVAVALGARVFTADGGWDPYSNTDLVPVTVTYC